MLILPVQKKEGKIKVSHSLALALKPDNGKIK
jgi:hypothetical protein